MKKTRPAIAAEYTTPPVPRPMTTERRFGRWIAALATLGACATPQTPADGTRPPTESLAAQQQRPLHERIRALLGHEGVSDAEWRSLGPQTTGILEQIA